MTPPAAQTPMPPGWRVRRADWARDGPALRRIREQVFVGEQGVSAAEEWEGLDPRAVHLIAEDPDGNAIATARLLPSGQIGRMAVVRGWRGRGVGRALLRLALRIAREDGLPAPFLHAQTQALGFYERLGFAPQGEVFDEAGIAHQRMTLPPGAAPGWTLGRDAGLHQLRSEGLRAEAVAAMAAQAVRQLDLLSPDLEPAHYDQPAFLDAVRRLAVARTGRLPVRILLADADPARRRGHRLITLAQALTSSIRILAPPEEWASACDPCLLADEAGYCLRHLSAPERMRVDFADPTRVRRCRRTFDTLWERAVPHPELQRLSL